ncbi:DUF4174 domain-containing protein [Roseovarius salinarum]|uniref:DUF4174 domain-containing protein n=1 Tax=Roseovarius salinarum TaxID=1981892 RepID=UPI000C33B81A|nr:DUF4174 domain-containing protein [Roseovarius salinarum]
MRPILALVFAGLTALPAAAQDAAESAPADSAEGTEALLADLIRPADDTDLKDFIWTRRPLVVFADSPADPRYVQQMKNIRKRPEDLTERDVVVLTDTDPEADSALREELHPRGFAIVLVGKDGKIYLRKPVPWDVREIGRVIDKMPMRQQEIEDRRGGES